MPTITITHISADGTGTTSIRTTYEIKYGTNFEVDGNLVKTLKVEGSTDYVRDWIREKLRKMENGRIKVVKCSSGERDWEQEEKIKKQLWEDINVNSIPQGCDFNVCSWKSQTASASVEYRRPPSPPCRIS